MKSLLYALLMICTGAVALHAQLLPGEEEKTPVAIGVFGNYHLTNHTLDGLQIQGIANCCPDFEKFDGSSIAFGALVEFPLTNALRLNLRGGYQNLKTKFTAQKKYGKGELNNNVVEVTSEKSLDANVPMITIEPEVSYRVFGRLDVHGGVRAGLALSPSYHYEERVVSENFTFGGSKTRNAADGDFENVSSMLFSAVVGLSYDLPFGKNIFSPEVRYAIPLNTLSDADWKTTTVHIGAAFKIPLRPAPPVQILRDTVYQRDTSVVGVKGIASARVKLDGTDTKRDTVRDKSSELHRVTIAEHYVLEQPVSMALRTNVELAALAADGSVVPLDKLAVEQIQTEDNFPMLPYVFFPDGSNDLTQTKLRLITAAQTQSYSMSGLKADNALGLYPEMLNIVGYRMRMAPKATITVTGCNSDMGVEANNTALSSARAKVIKDYLTSVWGIEPSRINVKARDLPAVPSNKNYVDGQEENRRVEIAGRDLLKPMPIRDYTYESSFNGMRITPSVVADAGVRQWKLSVVQGSTVLKEYTGTDTPSPVKLDLDVRQIAEARTPIMVRLEATDNDGQTKTAEQQLSPQYVTVQEKRANKKDDKLIERYSLVLFDYNRSALNDDHKEDLQVLGDKLRDRADSRVTIHGYTDRIGTSLSNEKLATRRAELVKTTLKLPQERVTLLPVGSKVLLFDNDHPVGRFYSRTVEIVVETPVSH